MMNEFIQNVCDGDPERVDAILQRFRESATTEADGMVKSSIAFISFCLFIIKYHNE